MTTLCSMRSRSCQCHYAMLQRGLIAQEETQGSRWFFVSNAVGGSVAACVYVLKCSCCLSSERYLCINWAGWRQQSVKIQITPGEPMKKVLLWLMDAFGSNVACWFRKHHTFFPWSFMSFTTVFKEDIPECSKLLKRIQCSFHWHNVLHSIQ